MVAGPAPAPVGALAIYKVAELSTVRAEPAESVGWDRFTRLNPVAVVMPVAPVIVAVDAGTVMPFQVADAPEAMVCAGVSET